MRKSNSAECGYDEDVKQVADAIKKIRDPMARYFVAMCVEIVAERLAEIPFVAVYGASQTKKVPRIRPASNKIARPEFAQLEA